MGEPLPKPVRRRGEHLPQIARRCRSTGSRRDPHGHAVSPSLGLVRHLTLSDERYWFEVVVAGGLLDFWPEVDNGDWQVHSAIGHADEIIANRGFGDHRNGQRTGGMTQGSAPDLRTIVVQLLIETSVHAGHLDAARELLDGRQHLVL